ncbi:hypothetical protein SAICODRAFT_87182 [Saitoella complicata NRRL Y-17804]|uniref:THUMP domain-containing protein n=1 Tax=Saitoella complicata (strain BCRC 22490 / CBS 7301 / JCM 7358 / NBRC 10748 / NRRL Y-17804) TaxID=698492 RepID=A0A0E9NRR7_SAICN|nr:uncharacterized protein SAICODRAFT_87182 [Saitoella complicata NRRL Y-17804]ODQ56410.1 hypothetical protein SAICODRAFT_87182 [Saitoella complicata NRRL Y-17804]GAO52559.1 hypothetical protein G7K_6632-t1 [Saitoella complicata NRRL Y-17804]
MGQKRGNSSGGGGSFKRRKAPGNSSLQPATSGVFVTCPRGKERNCFNEISNIMEEYVERLFPAPEELEDSDEDDEDDDIEASIQKELAGMKEKVRVKKDGTKIKRRLNKVDTGADCVLYIQTRGNIEPVQLVHDICADASSTGIKRTRYTQRMTPITRTGIAEPQPLYDLAKEILAPHFHKDEGQEPLKYAIRPSFRNHTKMNRDEVIKMIAGIVGHEHGHKVDLKNYDVLIIVEVFKNIVGMSVVRDFDTLKGFNIDQIHQANIKKSQEEKETTEPARATEEVPAQEEEKEESA